MKKSIIAIIISILLILIPSSISANSILENDINFSDSFTIDGIALLILYGYDFHYTDEEIIEGHITKGIMIGYIFSDDIPNIAILTDWNTVIPSNSFHGILLPFFVAGFVVS